MGIVSSSAMVLESLPEKEVYKGKFGAMEIVDWLEEGMKKEVHLPTKKFHNDYI